MAELVRYAKINTVLPREFLLLQGKGCIFKKCAFCDYHTDISDDPFSVNLPVLEQVTGEFGVLDIINSGSAMELDEQTLALIRQTADQKQIHTLWFEAHWLYHDQLKEFAALFPNQTVKFRCGAETFDPQLRIAWNKGIPKEVTAEKIAEYFQGVCLLIAAEGQTKEGILRDIETAQKHFEYCSLNVFVPNSTPFRRDDVLAVWFATEVAPALSHAPGVEILLNNTDLGVG
ncbi:radical SAM protein [Ructibacterium gallinarum]|uniref:Radical SAM protein n=1 Tax=Ructibacterium gallinarum TaxID=2779355 RepID=A0A9D5M2F0_9FIRM|nr:radical SAM protein [Ructibacterium gallinarum]MBE5040238.1 radical SAM protein [Ructibacterium gallinarum]